MRVLSIDCSSSIGWSYFEDKKLLKYGVEKVANDDKTWPFGIHEWAKKVAMSVESLVKLYPADKVIIERANSSSFRKTQNFIDWFHFAIIQNSLDNQWADKLMYRDSAEWRRIVGLKLSAEDKKRNKLVKAASRKGEKVFKIDGARVGKISKKHLSVRLANELFNLSLKLKDNDVADSLLLGYSYFQ